MRYKYDFHCHVNEGSGDSRIKAKDYIESLIKQGFTGFLVSDHDTYNGYKYIKSNLNYKGFSVLKGIECSTVDAGHILVIMPDEYNANEFECKFTKLNDLIKFVHSHHGILGPAHPFSEPYLSIFSSKKYKDDYDICNELDFMEVFNAGELEEENNKASLMADKYNLFKTAGSDAHCFNQIGKAYIELDENIDSNNKLIEYIKKHKPVRVNGTYYVNHDREKYSKIGNAVYLYNNLLVRLFSFKNYVLNK